MLYLFGFDEIGVVVGDLFFVDANPGPGQEGAEKGVRVELRSLERLPLRASDYSAIPIAVETPRWRVDLLESVPDGIGQLDRVHHHPVFSGWDPGYRKFDKELTADPIGWLQHKLSDLPSLLGVEEATDTAALAASAGEILRHDRTALGPRARRRA